MESRFHNRYTFIRYSVNFFFELLLPGTFDLSVSTGGCVCVCVCAQLCPTLCDPMDCSPPRSSVHGIFPGKNIGVGCHFLLQGIFLIPGIKPAFLASLALAGRFLPLCHVGSKFLNEDFFHLSLELNSIS